MKITLKGHDCKYALEQALLIFFPDERPEFTECPDLSGDYVISELDGGGIICKTAIRYRGKAAEALEERVPDDSGDVRERERSIRFAVKNSFCRAAAELIGGMPPWGSLTGVKPVKMASRLYDRLGSREKLDAALRDSYFVSKARRRLCIEAAEASRRVRDTLERGDISLYVSVPFCPSRCGYCSFVSSDVSRSGRLTEPYLDALEREIRACAVMTEEYGFHVRNIYIGGGTPTVLTETQLAKLLDMLGKFDLSRVNEITVEAGRPDTVNSEKISRIVKMADILPGAAVRISVNPQSIDDGVLERIGRRHTGGDALRAFETARQAGAEYINMDIIAGLPGDTPGGFRRTLDAVLGLGPDNITVHTLSLKRGSSFNAERVDLPVPEDVANMLGAAFESLRGRGYEPYYLYRQKFMAAAFENTGWTLPGRLCAYNICIMEELCPVLALGAGAVSKTLDRVNDRIERVINPKYPLDYINRLDDVTAKKPYFFINSQEC